MSIIQQISPGFYFLRIPCTPILKNGKVYLELFSVPQFTTENNEPFDPFGFVNIAKRVDSRSQYIDSIKKVLSSFATDLVDINFASIDFKLTPKNIILDDRLGVLSNTNGTIKARPMEHLTFNSSKAVVRISNDYTNQLLGEAFQERLGGNGTVVFMRGSSSQNPGSLTINIQIAHFEKRDNIFLFPDVEVRVNVYCTYFLYFLNQANNVSALRGTMLNYSYDINIDNLPPFYNADSDMNQIVDQIKAQVARELYFEKAFNTQNAQYPRVALTFESGELEILLNK